MTSHASKSWRLFVTRLALPLIFLPPPRKSLENTPRRKLPTSTLPASTYVGLRFEHIIVLDQRGLSDSAIRERILKEELVFLTHDSEFGTMPGGHRGTVLISRIKQSLPIQKRTEIWFNAVERFMIEKPAGKVFELLETGDVVAWEVHETE